MMAAVLLHLSDIHIKNSNDPILKRGEDIAACIFSSLPLASNLFIVVSGDVAFSGEEDQYVLATKFLKTIQTTIQHEKPIPVSFIVVPGNHDCDFSQDSGARKMLIKNLEGSDASEIDTSVIETCTAIQKPFFKFREDLEGNKDADDDLLWRSSRFNIENKILGFECLNVSWVSKLNEEPGHLYFPIDRYSDKKTNDVDVRIVILHHPLNWFNQNIYRSFRTSVRQLADIVISGHEHQGNVGVIKDAETEKSAFVEGCVLQGEKDLSDSSFNVVILDLSQGQFASTRYNWDKSQYAATEEGSWSDYHNLPAKRTNLLAISKSFKEVLDDPGAFFKHPGRSNITLTDIFIYPDLQRVNDNGGFRRKNFINASRLLSPDVTADGLLIEGEEKVGRTSLLYQLYRQYHDRGFVPLLLKGKDLKKTNDREIDALIKRAVKNQYGTAHITTFEQIPSSRKLLLLDDFDDGPMKAADARAGLLCALRKRFGHLVVTVSEMFEMREILDWDSSRELISLEHYQLQPLGYVRRSELIERWFSLSADGTVDEANLISRCDEAERLIDKVMTNSVIPSLPLYLLTLLQSMDAGRSGDFRESALGYYYQYLLSGSLQSSGVKPNKLTEFFQYSAHLAWEFHSRDQQELSEIELRQFNSKFSDKWHTVDFSPRINVLLKARVLCRVGEDYAFRYPYIYYYLKGQYLSENLTDLDIREYIGHCCKHLYVRDHANTVLFLAHHTNDDFVLTTISQALHGLFQACSPLTFNGDTTSITSLIEDAPKLIYSGEKPTEHRKKRNVFRDKIDDGQDGLVESEEESDELSLLAKITMLFKTTEILGQVLKNQYSKIQRNRKVNLLEELFNGPLRALRDFYDFFEKNPNALDAEIEAALQRKKNIQKEDHNLIARKFVASFIQLITFSFIMRAAQGASTDSLSEEVQDVVNRNGTLAFKLIELCIHLDSPKAIPKQKLKQLIKEAEKDLIASRLIKLMVLNRLYMFKTTEEDMQWLSNVLELSINTQHIITYQEKKRRLIR